MSVLAGKDGYVKLGSNKIGYIDNYSLSIEQGTAEVSEFEDQWRSYIGTGKGFSGSFSGTFDYGDTDGQKAIVDDLIGNGGTVNLEFKTSLGLVLVCTAEISNATVGGSHSDKISISFNFQGNGGFTKKMAPPVILVEPYMDTYKKISIASVTGATIYYTTNGDTPDEDENEYDNPIYVSSAATIKAIASLSGYENSDVASKVVTF